MFIRGTPLGSLGSFTRAMFFFCSFERAWVRSGVSFGRALGVVGFIMNATNPNFGFVAFIRGASGIVFRIEAPASIYFFPAASRPGVKTRPACIRERLLFTIG